MLDAPDLDTWLARHLLEQGRLELTELQQLVAEARSNRRSGGPTLAQSLIRKGLLSEDEVRGLLAEVTVGPPPAEQPTPPLPQAALPQLGGYRLLKRLGAGGMGTVYLGEHLQTGARRAVKVLPTTDPELVERFRREGEAQARVAGHPNVVNVHSSGAEGGRFYLVMDLASGGDLSQRLKEGGPLEVEAARSLVAALARGLEHVHGQGVLHRDLKPANVLFDEHGTPKLVDFGLARIAGAGTLTESGTLMGTPSYMAPEQADSTYGPVDERSDVYGLGAILYKVLTGRSPFTGTSVLATLAQVLEKPPTPPRELRPEIPADLEAVCLHALEKRPGDRYPSAAALAEALEGSAESRRGRGWALPLAASGLAALLFAVLAALPKDADRAPPPLDQPFVGDRRKEAVLPKWWAEIEPSRRPTLPLLHGLVFGEAAGEYVNERDDSILVYVPGGRFRTGTDRGGLVASLEPGYWVEVGGFFLGKYELTQRAYARFCKDTQREFPEQPFPGGSHPVTYVTWHDAVAYCAWAGLRLPSEEEWEYAARGTDGREWPWGDASPGRARANLNLGEGTTVVGSFPDGASPFGCLDMCGNVGEWTQDEARLYSAEGRVEVKEDLRVYRGGNFQRTGEAWRGRTYSRYMVAPNEAGSDRGFRVALSAREEPPLELPAWWAALPERRRPELPLPKGLGFGKDPGEYVNEQDGSILVYVSAGTFFMGNDGGMLESPRHEVELPGFFMGKFELTEAAYAAFCRETGRRNRHVARGPTHPVGSVSWHDAVAYCEWAGLRLPSEAEWEYAARGRGSRTWPWGNEGPGEGTHANLLGSGTTPVGSFPQGASPFGCEDMSGNVREWVQDTPRDYGEEGERIGTGGEMRLHRGGSWEQNDPMEYSRTFSRELGKPAEHLPGAGFRVARSAREDELPAWWAGIPPGRRPRLPLPEGFRFGDAPGDYVNAKDGSVLRWVPAAAFIRGRAASVELWGRLSAAEKLEKQELDPSHPKNKAQVAAGFFLGKLELSEEKYRLFCERTGRNLPAIDLARRSPQAVGQPVVGVSWDDAVAYCRWAGLRLPTELEWELGARGTDARRFPWGDMDSDPTLANARGEEDGALYVAKGGSFPKGVSPHGCLDMAGNAAEWTLEAFDTPDLARVDPSGSYRATRGGSWGTGRSGVTTYERNGALSVTANEHVGFRVARSGR